jgi:hypothetical protein
MRSLKDDTTGTGENPVLTAERLLSGFPFDTKIVVRTRNADD